MKKLILVLALSLLSVKLFAAAPGDVVINELMWMGTAASSSDEWIELYNNTNYDVDVSSWVLKSADGVPSIPLTGIIKANSYYLLERTDDNTVSDIAADKLYTGALSDIGEDLVLYDSYTVAVDSVPCAAGWFAGAKAPYYSMERINPLGSGWLSTNWSNNNGEKFIGLDAKSALLFATPKAQNSVYYDGEIVMDNGTDPAAPEYKVRITEVAFAASTDWAELYNYGETPVDISNFMLTDLDGTDSKLATSPVTLAPGKYAVVYWDEAGVDETDATGDLNHNGVIDLYVPDTGLSATTDELALMSAPAGGRFIDAVCWSDGVGDFTGGENNDVKLLADNGQWLVAGDTVTKSDCWTNSSQVTAERSIGRVSPLSVDTNGKNDWHLFNGPSPGKDNPDFNPPQVQLDFDPAPPFIAGVVNVTLRISSSNTIVATPLLDYSIGSGAAQAIALTPSGNDWTGSFTLPRGETDNSLVFHYFVVDSAKNPTEQEASYLGLAYVPPDYGQTMYCYPNPWTISSRAKLKFSKIGEEEAEIRIFTLAGELVTTLRGQSEAYWDGTNDSGERVAAGIYLYLMENSQVTRKGKIAVIK